MISAVHWPSVEAAVTGLSRSRSRLTREPWLAQDVLVAGLDDLAIPQRPVFRSLALWATLAMILESRGKDACTLMLAPTRCPGTLLSGWSASSLHRSPPPSVEAGEAGSDLRQGL